MDRCNIATRRDGASTCCRRSECEGGFPQGSRAVASSTLLCGPLTIVEISLSSPYWSSLIITSHFRRGSNWVIPDSSSLILSSLLFLYFQRIYSVLANIIIIMTIMSKTTKSLFFFKDPSKPPPSPPCDQLPLPSPVHHGAELSNGNFQCGRPSCVKRLHQLARLPEDDDTADQGNPF